MNRDRQRLIDCLMDILQAIERIGRYTDQMDETVFLQNELVQLGLIWTLKRS